jgi:2-iminobutanoate/2-iminopropanoate deaminase
MDERHPYSLVRRVGQDRGYVSGVLPYRPDGSLAAEPAEAIRAVLDTLDRRVTDAGFVLADVVKATVFLTDLAWLPVVNRAWSAAFADPAPARSAVEVAALPRGAVIEVEAILEREGR